MSERRIVVICCDGPDCQNEVEAGGTRGARKVAKEEGWRVNHSGHDYCPDHLPHRGEPG